MKFIYLSLALWACRNEEKVAANLDDNQVENIDRDEDGYELIDSDAKPTTYAASFRQALTAASGCLTHRETVQQKCG